MGAGNCWAGRASVNTAGSFAAGLIFRFSKFINIAARSLSTVD